MNVLIIGGTSSLVNQLIRKCKKEGHRVHLLTGNRYADGYYEKVFERYDLPYDSECLTDVFDSVNPDVTLFMGAFDTNFNWADEQREMVRFTSSITNLLMSFSMSGKGRFIYLSSHEVFSKTSDTDILEDVSTDPNGVKAMAVAQGEEICNSFIRIRDYDIVTLRLDHFYRMPVGPSDVDEICTSMCLEALRDKKVTVDGKRSFSLLYESDAVEFIYQLFRRKEHSYSVYNVSSSMEISQLELAEYIKEAFDNRENPEKAKEPDKKSKKTKEPEKKADETEAEPLNGTPEEEKEEKEEPEPKSDDGIKIEINENAAPSRIVLSNTRFDNEFGVRIFADTEKNVDSIIKYMLDHKEVFLSGEELKRSFMERLMSKAGWLVRAMIPYLENILFFILFFFLNSAALKSQYLSRLDLYLLYVLIFAVVHGQQQATFSAIFAVFGYFFGQMGERSVLNIVLDYNTYIWIAQLFIVGLVVGYMKDQIRKLRDESDEERHFLNRQLTDIKDINGSNVRVKDALETQIVNQNDSIGKIYSITSRLEKYTPEEVLFYAVEMVRDFLGSNDIAIYTVSNEYYARLFTFTSDKAKSLGKSIRYRELGEMYDTLSEKRVFINRTLDERYPMMSAPVFDKDDMQIIIMAWGIPWERMTLGQADLLMVVSYLIQNAVLRAARYITLIENRRYEENRLVMGKEVFTPLVRVFLEAKEKALTECVLLRLIPPEGEEFSIKPDILKAAAPAASIAAIPVAAAAAQSGRSGRDGAADAIIAETKKKEVPSAMQPQDIQPLIADGHEHVSEKKQNPVVGFIKMISPVRIVIKSPGGVKHDEKKHRVRQEEFVKDVSAHDEELHKAPTASAAPLVPAFAAASVLTEKDLKEDNDPVLQKYEEMAKGLVGKIRNTDYLGILDDGNMYVLLCNTNSTEAESAVERIKSGGYNCVVLEDFRL